MTSRAICFGRLAPDKPPPVPESTVVDFRRLGHVTMENLKELTGLDRSQVRVLLDGKEVGNVVELNVTEGWIESYVIPACEDQHGHLMRYRVVGAVKLLVR